MISTVRPDISEAHSMTNAQQEIPIVRRLKPDECVLFVSQHHDDATPGSSARIDVDDTSSVRLIFCTKNR